MHRAPFDAATAAQVAAEDAHERRMALLRAGEVTMADLCTSETDLNAARLALLDASVQQEVARARLSYAIGEEH